MCVQERSKFLEVQFLYMKGIVKCRFVRVLELVRSGNDEQTARSKYSGYFPHHGLVFGVMHAYQGWRAVVTISVLGMMFGGLAAWRRTLRIGMVAHAWQDVWAGWLSHILTGRFG